MEVAKKDELLPDLFTRRLCGAGQNITPTTLVRLVSGIQEMLHSH